MRGKTSRWCAALLWSFGLFLAGNIARADDGDDSTAAAAAATPAPKSAGDRLKDLEDRLSADEESNNQKFKQVAEDKLRLHFNLYGDGEYRVNGPSGSFPQQNGFYLGQTDLHLMAQYGAHLGAMVEDVVEFDGQNPSIDFERVLVSYTFDDRLRIGAGRDHTCFGYWNRTFHHGSQFQTTIDRPFFLAFEDGGGSDQAYKQTGVVPNHIVGVFANGDFDLGGSSL